MGASRHRKWLLAIGTNVAGQASVALTRLTICLAFKSRSSTDYAGSLKIVHVGKDSCTIGAQLSPNPRSFSFNFIIEVRYGKFQN